MRWTVSLLLILATAGLGRAQRPATDPVERLRQVLRCPAPDAPTRDRWLKECLNDLHDISDLRRALLLAEWNTPILLSAENQMDRLNRDLVADRFAQEVRLLLRRNDAVTTGVVLDMVGESASTLRRQGTGSASLRALGPALAELARHGNAQLRAAALRTIVQIDADAGILIPLFSEVSSVNDEELRMAALEAVETLLHLASEAASRSANDVNTSPKRVELVRTITAMLPIAGRGLTDVHSTIRRRSAAALGAAAAAMVRLYSDPSTSSGTPSVEPAALLRLQAERSEIGPMLAVLRDQGVAVARCLRDDDGETRLAMLKALQEIANLRYRWLDLGSAQGTVDDPLRDVFAVAMVALAQATTDPDVRVRRSAVEVLELVGPAAAPAAPAVAAALDDNDRFVRWSAIRALRHIGPVAARCATPGLTRLLEDGDADIRLAAAAALQEFGPSGAPAIRTVSHNPGELSPYARATLPPLLRSLRSDDADVRIAAMRTLKRLGAEARPAVTGLRELLDDANPHIRQTAAETLGAIGPAARSAVDDLRRALQDENADVRRSAGEAILIIRQVQ
jgi:HEAT repeat protein